MGNINDYLLWRGDIPITEYTKLNEVDNMILARISYLRFDKIEFEDGERIETISKKMKNLSNEEFLYNGDKELITYLGQSERFKNMVVTDYIKTEDKGSEKQFGAVTIHISNDEMYISYIGTDSTITGWKEDLNMAFMDNVPCQIEGRKYLEKIAKKFPNKKILIGGHSKGGNVAIYSAVTSNEEVKNKIKKVTNLDGPGFSKEIVSKYENNDIINKIVTYIPQDSIIGRFLNHNENIIICYSTEKGILQHDVYSWQVQRFEVIRLEKNTETSENINKTVTDWLEATTVEQRKIFIDSLFELFYSTDANTFGDIKKSFSKSIPKIFKKYKQTGEEDRKTMIEMLKTFAMSYILVIKDKQVLKFENMKEEFSERYFSKIKKKEA